MIYKEFESFSGHDSRLLDVTENGLQKIASLETHIPDKLASLIGEIESNPNPDYAYLYDRALGAGEVYGPNNNGDWFGRDELKAHHGTFEKHAHLFRHHQNKDPRNSVGDVMASAYNKPLDVVDLIVRAPRTKIAKDLQRFENGGMIQTSMGAKVKKDVCSICGNESRTRLQYCGHLRNKMLKILPDGRQVFAKNPKPKFVDISIVVIPADPASTVLRKVASLQDMFSKGASIKKTEVGSNLEERRPVMRPELVEATNDLDRGTAVQTLHEANGVLRPDEFQAVLNKDASLLRPDIIPYVDYCYADKQAMSGRPLYKLAHVMQDIPGTSLDKEAKLVCANFLTEGEKDAYLQYRHAIGDFSKVFLR